MVGWLHRWGTSARGFAGGALCVLVVGVASTAAANEPVAIVEDISVDDASVELFDYLVPGQEIALAADASMVVSYFASCRREEITGGVTTIGDEKSTVVGGTLESALVQCDAGHLQLTDAQAAESGVLVLRRPPPASGGLPEVALTIYATHPLFRVAGEAEVVVVTRLDRPDPPVRLPLAAGRAELDKDTRGLKRGGLYHAMAGRSEIVFRVDKYSRPGDQPLLSRLVPM